MKPEADGSKDKGVNGIWAWAGSLIGNPGHDASKPIQDEEEADDEQPTPQPQPSAVPGALAPDDRAMVDLINEMPTANASTLYNSMKARGFKIIAPPEPAKAEADSGTSQPAGILIGQKKMQSKRESKSIRDGFITCKFLEGVASDKLSGPTKFKTILIQEGMGNLKDAFYYTRQALESAVPVFEGKKVFADHPARDEEQTRPERSVRDVLGYFEGVHIEESDDGRALLVGELVTMPEEPFRWARALMSHAVEYAEKFPDSSFIGLSINASGDANPTDIGALLEMDQIPQSIKLKIQKAQAQGVQTVRLVTAIKDAVSCDLVTEAGAGGKISEMLEMEKQPMAKMNQKQKKENKVDPAKGFEKKEGAHHEDDEMPVTPTDGGGDDSDLADPDHADAAQDIELIKKMIAKHMGDDGGKDQADDEEKPAAPADHEDEGQPPIPPKKGVPPHAPAPAAKDGDGGDDAHAPAPKDGGQDDMHHAMQAYEYFKKEHKMEMDEAAMHAAKSVMCAKHMQKKAMEGKHAEAKKEDECEDKKEGKKESSKKEDEGKKESDVARLAGRVAFLESELKSKKLSETIETKLAQSKMPRSATKMFKESIGTVKSVEEFDKLFSVFEKAYRVGGEAGNGPLDLSIEKTSRLSESTFDGGVKGGFGDCVKN